MVDDNRFSVSQGKRTQFAEFNNLPNKEELQAFAARTDTDRCETIQKTIKPISNLTEFKFYSEKIETTHWENLFLHVFKRSIPLFDFLDLSQTLPMQKCSIIIKKYNKTVRFFIKNQHNIKSIAPLLFPFSFEEYKERIGESKSSLLPRGFYFITKTNVLDFIMKENVKSIELSVFPFFGKTIAIGKVIDEHGGKKILFTNKPAQFLNMDMEKNPAFYLEVIHHPILKTKHVESYKPLFEKDGTSIGVDNFDVFKHTLIAGMSGTGKSKYLSMKTKAIAEKYPDARIVVIDPHAEFSETNKNCKVVDFKNNYIEALETGTEKSPLTIQLISQLIASIIDSKNKYAERVIFYCIHLLSNIDKLTLSNISSLLTDSAKRMRFTTQTKNEEVKRFFSVEFEDIYMHHFNDAILPILNFIGQYELYMGGEKRKEKLGELITNNQVTVISFNPNHFGRNMIKFFAGAIIQQMYILAITRKLKQPTILVVDEFPVVETEVVKSILSETRKFNLHLHLSMQYLSQIREGILSSILTNVYNMIIFKLSKEDAKYIGGVMDVKVEEYFRKNWSVAELEEEKKNMFIHLSPRECVVRLYGKDGRFMLPMKVRTVEVNRWL